VSILALLALTGVGCYSSPASQSSDANKQSASSGSANVAQTNKVDIQGFTFSPVQIKVKKGDAITFTNKDSMQHSATANDGSFDTGLMSNGESRAITFNTTGTVNYHCKLHTSMQATVIVEE
jgi:plastocyanin